MIQKKNKGISLIVLIITIVVIIILATAIIVNVAKANIIKNAHIAIFKQDISTYKDELNMYISNEYTNKSGKYNSNLLDANKLGIYYNNEMQSGTILDILSIKGTKYEEMLYIEDGKLVLDTRIATQDQINWANSIGINSNTKVLVLSIPNKNSIKVELNSAYKTDVENYTYTIYELDENNNKILKEIKENVTVSNFTFSNLLEEKKYEIFVTLRYNDGTIENFEETVYLDLNVGTIENWNYALDKANQTVKLVSYKGTESNVTIYGSYEVNGIVYKTTLESNHYDQESSNFVQNNYMFENNTTLKSVKFKQGIDTSDIVGIAKMFSGCTSLESIDLSNFDTSNVTDVRELFSGCSSLKNVNLEGIDTSSLNNMCGMFYYCTSLESIDLSSLDTSNVTDMRNLFNGCSALKSVNLTGIDTSNVIKLNWMFFKCSALENVNVSGFITNNAQEMEAMFAYCSSLKELDLRNFETSNATNMAYMMEFCSKLEKVYVTRDKWITSQANTTRILADSGVSKVTYY